MKRLGSVLLTCGLLGACDGNSRAVRDLPDVQAGLAFAFTQDKDKIRPLDHEADRRNQHAKWLKKGNLLKVVQRVYLFRFRQALA